MIAVRYLKQGDVVDLQGDKFADDGEHPEFEFEGQTVADLEVETDDCTVVHFNELSVGFPPDHLVKLMSRP